MGERLTVAMYDGERQQEHRAFKEDGRIFVEKGKVPDSDQLVITDPEGFRYRRVIVPENYFLFERV